MQPNDEDPFATAAAEFQAANVEITLDDEE